MHYTTLFMNDYSSISEMISKRRRFLGLTQDALASRAGVSLRSLKSIEAAEGNPTLLQLTKVLHFLGLKLTAVLR